MYAENVNADIELNRPEGLPSYEIGQFWRHESYLDQFVSQSLLIILSLDKLDL